MTRCSICRTGIPAVQRDGTDEVWCFACIRVALLCADRWLRLWDHIAARRLRELAGYE